MVKKKKKKKKRETHQVFFSPSFGGVLPETHPRCGSS
jgi:hypothetical protein